jgi:uncharacterized protein HemY
MEAGHASPGPRSTMMEYLFEGLEPSVQEALLLGAIPHVLDAGVANILFPGFAEQELKKIRSLRFSSENRQGQIELHISTRRYLLEIWQRRNPARFREISGDLAREYQHRVGEPGSASISNASEWLFHALAANPADAIRLMANLFHELLESRELSAAERLIRLVQEQEPWIGGHILWLEYFQVALSFSHYQDVNVRVLEKLIQEQPGTQLAAYSFRLLGRIAVRRQFWAEGRNFLRSALQVSNLLGDIYQQALVYMDLGDLFQNLVENSGGILVEEREFSGFAHRFFYGLSRGPLLLYRLASERIDALPKFYGLNYQNWIAIHFMRQALRNYQYAKGYFKRLANHRAEVEINIRMARAYLLLGHSNRARRICEMALQDNLVRTSPYYNASFQSILGEADVQQGSLSDAINRLSDSLKTYEQYSDWDAVGRTALTLGKVYTQRNENETALDTYRLCLKAAFNSQNLLLRSEVAHHLNSLVQQKTLSEEVRKHAARMRASIHQLAFVDRYPGPVQAVFRKLANRLVYPFVFLFVIMLIAGGGISMQILEGEFRFQDLPSLSLVDIFLLSLVVLLPLLMVWAGQLTYFLVGQLIIYTLPLGKVDEAQPNIFVINEQNLIQKNSQGRIDSWIAWKDIHKAIFDNRSLYVKPLSFSSRIRLTDDKREMVIPATTFRYMELEKEIDRRLGTEGEIPITRLDFSILKTSWVAVALVFGFALGIAVVLFGNVGCYDVITSADFVCRPGRQTYIQSTTLYGLFFACIFFGIITWRRWKLADRITRKES